MGETSGKSGIIWEWESKKDVWVKFSEEIAKKIQVAINAKENLVNFEVEKSEIEVNLEKMVQKNKTTGFIRKIRCSIKAENGKITVFLIFLYNSKKSCTISPLHYYYLLFNNFYLYFFLCCLNSRIILTTSERIT